MAPAVCPGGGGCLGALGLALDNRPPVTLEFWGSERCSFGQCGFMQARLPRFAGTSATTPASSSTRLRCRNACTCDKPRARPSRRPPVPPPGHPQPDRKANADPRLQLGPPRARSGVGSSDRLCSRAFTGWWPGGSPEPQGCRLPRPPPDAAPRRGRARTRPTPRPAPRLPARIPG